MQSNSYKLEKIGLEDEKIEKTNENEKQFDQDKIEEII